MNKNTQCSRKLYRQGDVLFIPVAALPEGVPLRKRENGVVAYGEVTGHAHRLADLESAEVLECGNELYVRVTEKGLSLGGATFAHEEHGPITLPDGPYKVGIQREYSPAAIRNTAD